jgi:hypothetical protein
MPIIKSRHEAVTELTDYLTNNDLEAQWISSPSRARDSIIYDLERTTESVADVCARYGIGDTLTESSDRPQVTTYADMLRQSDHYYTVAHSVPWTHDNFGEPEAGQTEEEPQQEQRIVLDRDSWSSADFFAETPAMYTGGVRKTAMRSEPRRSEQDMINDILRSENFPRPNFQNWSSRNELQEIINNWYENVEYKENWIFSRREREGFNRRNIGQLHLDDIMARISKRKNGHSLDNELSKFYDWKLGGTEWILRLELLQLKEKHFLISRYIHKPSNAEIRHSIRYWSESHQMFRHVQTIFSESEESKNKNTYETMVFGNYFEDEECESEDYEDEDY